MHGDWKGQAEIQLSGADRDRQLIEYGMERPVLTGDTSDGIYGRAVCVRGGTGSLPQSD